MTIVIVMAVTADNSGNYGIIQRKTPEHMLCQEILCQLIFVLKLEDNRGGFILSACFFIRVIAIFLALFPFPALSPSFSQLSLSSLFLSFLLSPVCYPSLLQVKASLLYLRERIGVPRDMTVHGARQLRAHINWFVDSL